MPLTLKWKTKARHSYQKGFPREVWNADGPKNASVMVEAIEFAAIELALAVLEQFSPGSSLTEET